MKLLACVVALATISNGAMAAEKCFGHPKIERGDCALASFENEHKVGNGLGAEDRIICIDSNGKGKFAAIVWSSDSGDTFKLSINLRSSDDHVLYTVGDFAKGLDPANAQHEWRKDFTFPKEQFQFIQKISLNGDC